MIANRGIPACRKGRALRAMAAVFLPALAALGAAGCRRGGIHGVDALGYDDAKRRVLYLQIVDAQDKPEECGILETNGFHYFLRMAAGTTEEKLRRERSSRAEHKRLLEDPDACRGHVASLAGVLLEVKRADPPAGLGLDDYEVLKAGLVTPNGGYFELRLLVRKGDPDMPAFRNGRVVRVAARFFKVHAYDTARKDGKPFFMPLLIGPKPLDRKREYDIYGRLAKEDMLDLLPFERIEGPKTPARTVVELRKQGAVAVQGEAVPREALPARLKAAADEQRALDASVRPAAVIVLARGAKEIEAGPVVRELAAAGFARIAVKDEAQFEEP